MQQQLINFISRKCNEVLDLIHKLSSQRNYRDFKVNREFDLINRKIDLILDFLLMLESGNATKEEAERLSEWKFYVEEVFNRRIDDSDSLAKEFSEFVEKKND